MSAEGQAGRSPPLSYPSPRAYLMGIQRHVDVGDAVQLRLDKGLNASRVLVGTWHCQGASPVEVDLEKKEGGKEGRRALVGEGGGAWWGMAEHALGTVPAGQ